MTTLVHVRISNIEYRIAVDLLIIYYRYDDDVIGLRDPAAVPDAPGFFRVGWGCASGPGGRDALGASLLRN